MSTSDDATCHPPIVPPADWRDGAVRSIPILLAILLSLTSAWNSDLWLRLASGRRTLETGLFSSPDPFAYTLPAGGGPSPGWLADVGAFLVLRHLGGSALVVVKVVLCVAVAACLLGLVHYRRHPLLGLVAVTLVLTSLALRLPLHPVCFSYLFLALTLLSLRRAPLPGHGFAAHWPLLLLFALWSNLDSWFLLGPFVVGLHTLGGWAESFFRPEASSARPPKGQWLFALAGLLACSINPTPWRLFSLPIELAPGEAGRVLPDDPFVRQGLFSPLQVEFYHSGVGVSAGVVAFLALVAIGIVASVRNRKALRWAWVIVWGGLLGLALYRARAIPFFAIVAGPFLVWNLTPHLPSLSDLARRVVRLGLVVVGVVALVAAWPGWLQPRPFEPRGWRVEPDPSCARLAARLVEWKRDGRMPRDKVGFNFSPHTANHLAWLLPGERWYLDSRLPLFDSVIDEFDAVRRGLREGGGEGVREVFRERGIAYVLLREDDRTAMATTFQRLLARPDEWPLLGLEGNIAVFGWRDPEVVTETFHPFDPDRSMVRSGDESLIKSRPTLAPPALPLWVALFTWNPPSRSADTDEAALDLLFFEASRQQNFPRRRLAWDAAGLGGLVGGAHRPSAALLPAALLGAWARGMPGREAPSGERLATAIWVDLQSRRDDGPVSALYLAIRSARRALRSNPSDARAQMLLGEAYTRLSRQTTERLLTRSSNRDLSLPFLRQVQAVVALQQALMIRPELLQAHAALVGHYQEMGFLDLALSHQQSWASLVRRGGPAAGESADDFAARLAELDVRVASLEAAVAQARKRFAATPASLSLAGQAEAARQLGLAASALAMLEKSTIAAFGARGAVLELRLLLLTGRVQEVEVWLTPDLLPLMGASDYHTLRYLLAAAVGDSEGADLSVRELALAFHSPGQVGRQGAMAPPVRTVLSLALGQLLLDQPIVDPTVPAVAWYEVNRSRTFDRMRGWMALVSQDAELTSIRGLLALENGQVERATLLLRQALSVWATGAGIDFPTRSLAESHLDRLRRAAYRAKP